MISRVVTLILLLALFITPSLEGKGMERDTTDAWMDSIIAEGVRKIGEAEAWRMTHHTVPKADALGNITGSNYIIIDAANWAPSLVSTQHYYERAAAGNYFVTAGTATSDSVNDFNWRYNNRTDYVAYYNIVIHNFPFELKKNISNVGANEGQCMFAQLQAMGAIEYQSYDTATAKFYTIIHNIAVQAQTKFQLDDVVCYGCANMLGQYGNKNQYRASYVAEMIACEGMDTSLPWIRQLLTIPHLLHSPGSAAFQNITDKNAHVSLAVRNFIECNQYGVCRPDASVFTNVHARWLFSKLAGNPGIDQQRLMNTCMKLNQLSNEMAWSVLTADYENSYTTYNTEGLVIPYYSNSTLDTISGLVTSIIRGSDQLKYNTGITRDSALYFGRLLYRLPSYIYSIPCAQRIHLLKVITSLMCSDITSTTTPSDYANHCERICKALYTYVPEEDIRPFMDQLKSSKVIWDITYRLDNMTFGFFGDDNYTDFIFTISSYWKKAYPDVANGTYGFHVVKWSSEFFNTNSYIQAHPQLNHISIVQKKRAGWQYFGISYADSIFVADIYAPVVVHVKEGSLLPDLPGVKDLTVPAIFLDWLSHKKILDDAATTARVTLAVTALVTGVGEVIVAANVTMRVISAVEIAVSAADLVLLNQQVRQSIIAQFPNPQEGEEFLAAYERITMMINLSVAAKGLITHIETDFALYTSKFDEKESSLKLILGENSAEYKGMEKLRGELGTIRATNEFIEGLAPHLKAIHNRFELAGTEFVVGTNKITYYYRNTNNVRAELGKIENGGFSVSLPLNQMPPTSSYLNAVYITHHINRFDQEGCGFIVVKSWTEGGNPLFTTLPPRKFVGLRSEMDITIQKYRASNGDWTILRDELNLGSNTDLSGDEIYYITISPGDTRFSYDVPNGKERGAIAGEWVPGGYTKNGVAEASLVGSETITHNHDINQLLSNFTGTWEKIK